MTELQTKIWTELYRPTTFEELIFDNKNLVLNYLKAPLTMPSFILYSNKPGTGKTSLAKLIIKTLDCDSIVINASDERGIDTIRTKITEFARSMSSNPNVKKCVFMDEFDSVTKAGMDCLKSTMEEYSSTCFFIFTANDVSKIIEPIQSRCTLISFERPNKADIFNRLSEICTTECIVASDQEIQDLIDHNYPDIRSMVKTLQNAKIEGKSIIIDKQEYQAFLNAIKSGDITYIYNKVYSGDFDIYGYNRWLFTHIFMNSGSYTNVGEIALCCAEVEKGFSIGVNAPIIFIANMTKISKLMGNK